MATTLLVALASSLVMLSGGARASEPVLAVLYVANHSGEARYDVLHKGLADMLVTDLRAQGLTVVERARLQALIDEQALQASSFIDPATAVRVGQGLGATHVVTGSLAAIAPQIRLDVRLVDVATGEVVVTASARGAPAGFFELEQELVARFVEAFDKRFVALPTSQTRVGDADALLDFAAGLDLADRGELERARERLDRAVSRAPAFGLARLRRDALVKQLVQAQERRVAQVADDRAALTETARRAVAEPATDLEARRRRLAWAGVRWRLMAQGLAPLMSARPFGVAAPGREAELERGMRALAEALADFVKWIDELHARHPDAWGRFALPPEDERRARALELSLSFPDEPGPARVVLARFVLLGELNDVAGASLTIAPPLAVIDPAWDRRARAALAEAVALGHAKARTREHGEHEAIVALEVLAEVELLGGRQEEAVRALQAALDRYPRARSFERIERRIKALLGIEPDATTRDLESWARGLAGCLDMSLRVGIDKIIYQRTRARGLAALAETVDEVERACAGQPSMTRFWDYLYARVARELGKHGRCAEFETWMAKAIAAGASPGDVEGWRRNWTECPLPPGAPPRR